MPHRSPSTLVCERRVLTYPLGLSSGLTDTMRASHERRVKLSQGGPPYTLRGQ
jgi:hypothetical protein